MSAELDPQTEIELAKHIALLAAAFPSVQLSAETVRVYTHLLADYLDVLEAAVEQCIASSRFFPSVGELRAMCVALTSDVTRQATPFEAWGEVLRLMGAVGCYGTPDFSTPLIARAVEVIGWKNLCLSENQVADRAHFTRVYEQLQKRAEDELKWLPASREMIRRVESAKEVRQLGPAPRTGLSEGREGYAP